MKRRKVMLESNNDVAEAAAIRFLEVASERGIAVVDQI